MSFWSFVEWCQHSPFSVTIRGSSWMFPAIEITHLLGQALLLGIVIIGNLRLAGLAWRDQPVTRISSDLKRWWRTALAVLSVSGVLLFFPEAEKCFSAPTFSIKLGLLALALFFQARLYRRAAAAETAARSVSAKLPAFLLLGVWFGIVFAGMWIELG